MVGEKKKKKSPRAQLLRSITGAGSPFRSRSAEALEAMAPGDRRCMTWQVLLTVSMLLAPAFAHGKCAAPTLCMCVRACMHLIVNLTVRLAFVLIPALFLTNRFHEIDINKNLLPW